MVPREIMVRKSDIARLVTGLGISGLLAAYFATAHVAEVQTANILAPANGEFSFSQNSTIIPVIYDSTGDDHDSLLLKQAFSTQTSDLFWHTSLPLDHRGDETQVNVGLSAAAVDFTALRPNEIFSFNNIVGMRSEEKGYQPGLMYSKGELTTGIGGGVCIVSTVLYNAALETGLKIIERHPHSGPVSYAEPGRDAAVSFGWADLCFKNNTDGVLLIRTAIENNKLEIALYGVKKPGQTVEILSEDYEEIPYKIFEKEDPTVPDGEVIVDQKARPGFAVTTIRVIRQNGKVVKREIISKDNVLPQNKIMRVPPRPEDAPLPIPDVEPLPPLPEFVPELPQTQPQPHTAPKSGIIHIPELAEHKEAVSQPLPKPLLPPTPEVPERNLSTSERTVSPASE